MVTMLSSLNPFEIRASVQLAAMQQDKKRDKVSIPLKSGHRFNATELQAHAVYMSQSL